eukprot:PITA_10600
MEVKYAFLNGDFDEEVYIEQPDGFILVNDPKLVCRLKKALYGLKQAPRAWCYQLDWAGSVDDRKRTSGGAFFMGSRLVSWFNKKQSSIALSTAKEEYVAATSCCTQLLWMMQTLQDIQITCTTPISIFCDNTSAISISKNPVMHSKTKNIPIKYHFLREKVLEQKFRLEYVPSKEQVADILIEPLPKEIFEYLRQKLWVVDATSCC